jgi:mono/diheme cytochrome c family protein
MKKIVQLMIMVTLGLTATSCYKDALPEAPMPANVSYQKDVQTIFNRNCIGCHKVGNTSPNLVDGSSYASLTTLPAPPAEQEILVTKGDAAGSILFQAMTGNGAPQMPPNGKLSATKLAIVEKWINDGALNN